MRVTTKGQVTIPKGIRDRLGIGPGSEVDFIATEDGAKLIAVNQNVSVEDARRRFMETLSGMTGTLDLAGMTADEYIDSIRGPREDLDLG